MLIPALLAAAAIVSATPAATPKPDPTGVRIINQSARWSGLVAIDDLAEGSESMFLISGEIENAGPVPVRWVKLGYELLRGDDVVLASEYGYNFRAEDLRSPAVEAGEIQAAEVPVQALAPGEKDLFRMVFFRCDVPPFESWRVRILEVR